MWNLLVQNENYYAWTTITLYISSLYAPGISQNVTEHWSFRQNLNPYFGYKHRSLVHKLLEIAMPARQWQSYRGRHGSKILQRKVFFATSIKKKEAPLIHGLFTSIRMGGKSLHQLASLREKDKLQEGIRLNFCLFKF